MTESKTPQSSTGSDRLLGLARMRPVLRARDVAAHGIHTGTLTRMARAGTLEKVGPGRYRLAASDVTESHSLVLACSIVPSSVVCLSTALLFHNLGTQLPREVWLAVPRGTRVPSFALPSNPRDTDCPGTLRSRNRRASHRRRRGEGLQRRPNGGRLLSIPEQGRPGRCDGGSHRSAEEPTPRPERARSSREGASPRSRDAAIPGNAGGLNRPLKRRLQRRADEIPEGLVKVTRTLRPVLNYKGTEGRATRVSSS